MTGISYTDFTITEEIRVEYNLQILLPHGTGEGFQSWAHAYDLVITPD